MARRITSDGDLIIDVEPGDESTQAYRSLRYGDAYLGTDGGDIVFRAGRQERGRIKADGTVTGVFAGGAQTLAAMLASSTDAGGHAITDLSDPSGAQDAATKSYVDSAVSTIAGSSQAGTAYTLALADKGTAVQFTSASPVTVTVPPNATVAFPVGAQLELYQGGTGQVTVGPGVGVTLHSPGGVLSTAAQYATLVLRQVATDVWVVGGELTSTAVDETILNAKGDLIVASAADTPARQAIGSDGQTLRADSTQANGVLWARPRDLLELQGAALGLVSMNYPPQTGQANSTSPSSQSLYGLRIGLRQGMQITGLKLNILTAAVGTAPTGAYVGIVDPSNVVRVQSGNLNASTGWTTQGFQTFAFGSTYTVPADGAYAAFLLINGTWGTTQPILLRCGGVMQDDVNYDFRQGSLTAPPANGSSVVPTNNTPLHFWVGCVGS